MNVETLVFIYIYLSFCVIIFDIFYVIYSKYTKRKILKCKLWVNNYLFNESLADKDIIKDKIIVKKLCDTEMLIAFHQVTIEKFEEQPEIIKKFLAERAEAFIGAMAAYSKKSTEKKAYLAYIVNSISEIIIERSIADRISNILLDWLNDDSLYVRENAMKAILGLRNPEKVVAALNLINKFGDRQNEKLICDGLLGFGGKDKAIKEKLAILVWENYSKFSLTIKLAMINYLRLLPKGIISENFFNNEIYMILKDESINKDIRLVALRYFRKYRYDESYKLIQQFAKERYNRNWELRAVAVSVLENYPYKESTDILVDALASRNWYVRFNSAESLLNMGLQPETLKRYTNDSFALEMMNYRNEIFELKKRRSNA